MKPKQTLKKANLVGSNLRDFRMEAGLTQKELAARCAERGVNLTRGTIAKIESFVRFVTACELFVISKVLKIDINRFFSPGFGDRVASARGKGA